MHDHDYAAYARAVAQAAGKEVYDAERYGRPERLYCTKHEVALSGEGDDMICPMCGSWPPPLAAGENPPAK